MRETLKAATGKCPDAELENYVIALFGSERRVVEVKRVPSEYQSSFAIENLQILLEDASELQVVFKNVGRDGLLPDAKVSKPQFIFDPMREIRTYTTILSAADLGTAGCYGFVADPAAHRYWLFLERIKGIELYQVGDLALWQRTAEWLARLHMRVNAESDSIQSRCHLLKYDSTFYRLWLERALRFCNKPEIIDCIAARYDTVIQRLLELPVTFIHGEFYASNVILAQTGDMWRVVPVDWEMAAVGPSLMDVAALTSGRWTAAERKQIELVYWNATADRSKYQNSFDRFVESIEYCRLHLCIQWLGWSTRWSPPPAQTNDWLGEAARIAQRLGIME